MAQKHIIHYGLVAGYSYYNATALRKIGFRSQNVIPSYLEGADQKGFKRNLPFDRSLYSSSARKPAVVVNKLRFLLQVIQNACLVHYYHDTVLQSKSLDAKIFHSCKIPMAISWAGSEARIVSLACKNNPYFFLVPNEQHDNQVRRRLERISNYVRYVITDPELAEYSRPYFDKVFIVPQPFDLATSRYRLPEKETRRPRILHIPTNREIKGTAYVETAVEKLRTDGLSFDFDCLPPCFTQQEVRQLIAETDIYVDELRCGSYGITAIEAMASGKPALTYIREDLLEQYPKDLPLVNANPDTIYLRLKELIVDAERRREIGVKSRTYVEKNHSLEVVGAKLLQVYQEIGLKEGV